jgi:hypothetical protein
MQRDISIKVTMRVGEFILNAKRAAEAMKATPYHCPYCTLPDPWSACPIHAR